MSYQLVQQLQKEAIPARQACRVLAVSRSGFYAAQQRQKRPATICAISVHLQASFTASGSTYGSRRLQAYLQHQGVQIGRYRVRSLMNQHNIKPIWRRKFIHTTDSKHDLPVAENILNRQFEPAEPNTAWVADITYIRTRRGWLYLAVVLDLYSRKVIGWAMAPGMPAELVCAALQMAIAQRKPARGMMVHSDRGSQYASEAYQNLLAKHGLRCSMSRKGNCWDNAVMERFFLNLKMERVWRKDYANHAEATNDIADYIVAFYNCVRLHSKLGNLPPIVYEQQQTEKVTKVKKPILVSENT